MLHPKFYGTITGKDFTLDKPDQFKAYLNKLSYKNANARIELVVKRIRKVRSVNANNYYWANLNMIANEIGEDNINGLHEYFKAKHNVDYSGKLPVVKSTTELSTLEFMEYVAKIGREVADFGITLLDPNEFYKE